MYRSGDAYPSRLGEGLEARSDVHAVTVDVVAVDDDFPEVDADAELEPACLWHFPVALRELALHGNRAGDGVGNRRELGENGITGKVHDDAAVALHRIGHAVEIGAQGPMGADLVLAAEAAVAGDIGIDNGRQLSLETGVPCRKCSMRCLRRAYLGNQAVADLGNGLDYPGVPGIVAERLAQLGDGIAERVIADHHPGPDLPLQLLPGDRLAGAAGQIDEHRDGSRLELDAVTVPADSVRGGIDVPAGHRESAGSSIRGG